MKPYQERFANFFFHTARLAGACIIPTLLLTSQSVWAWDYDPFTDPAGQSLLTQEAFRSPPGAEQGRLSFPPRAVASVSSSERPVPRPTRPDMIAEVQSRASATTPIMSGNAQQGDDPDAMVSDMAVAPATAHAMKARPDPGRQGEEKSKDSGSAPEFQSPALETADVTATDFSAMRRASLREVSDPDTQAAGFAEHARILLGGLFLPEAAEASRVARRHLAGADRKTAALLDEIDSAIESLGGPGLDAPEASGTLWVVLQDIDHGITPGADRIAKAAGEFPHQSRAVIGAALPLLLGAAIDGGAETLARELLETGEGSGLIDGSDLLFVQGRVAELAGEEEKAFDLYARAMETFDIAGIKARIALADIVLGRDRPDTFPELRRILSDGVAQWRGDALSRAMLVRLAAVTEDMGDRPAALSVMARILAEFPSSEEAGLARSRSPMLLAQLRSDAEEGKMDLDSYILALRDLEQAFRMNPQWLAARRSLADLLDVSGLRVAAAAEYRAIRKDISAGSPASDRFLEEIAVAEAEILVASGKMAAARAVLAARPSGRFSEITSRHRLIEAQLRSLSLAGAGEASSMERGQDPALSDGRAAIHAGSNEEAVRHYEEYRENGNSLPRADISRYILAKSETVWDGDVNLTQDPDAQDIEALLIAGGSLSRSSSEDEPLSGASAKASLDASQSVLDSVSEILGKKPGRLAE